MVGIGECGERDKNIINEMLRCENYLTAITSRSRNLIHFHSIRHWPN